MAEFARGAEVNPRGVISSVEAFRWHRRLIEQAAGKYDPRVIVRIRPGETVSDADYRELLRLRQRFVEDIEAAAHGYDALLMPVTADTAPTIGEVLASDESYFRFNGRMLRNPALVNLFDGCALSVRATRRVVPRGPDDRRHPQYRSPGARYRSRHRADRRAAVALIAFRRQRMSNAGNSSISPARTGVARVYMTLTASSAPRRPSRFASANA